MDKRHLGIDGLRGLAIGLVVIFHFFPEFLPGGFLGVDLFFVIAGFFITAQLAGRRMPAGQYLKRRVLRILPGLMAVLAGILVAGWFLSLTWEYAGAAKEGLLALFFLSNLVPQEGGYFGWLASQYPTTHFWTVSLEVQVYLIAAILAALLRCWARSRNALGVYMPAVYVLAGTAAASFVCWVSLEDAFYFPLARIWEFALGAAVYVWSSRVPGHPLHWLAAVLLTVFLAGWVDAAQTLFPFLAAGLMAVVVQPNAGGRIFEFTPLSMVGRWSYGIYLWHWPVLVFYAVPFGALPPWATRVELLLLSVVLGAVSFYVIEEPARRWRFSYRWSVFSGAAALLGASLLLVWLLNGVSVRQERVLGKFWEEAAFWTPEMLKCNVLNEEGERKAKRCQYGKGDPEYALMGDSHAVSLSMGLQALRVNFIDYSISGCPPSSTAYNKKGGAGCISELERALVELAKAPSVHTVILHGRWSRYAGDVPSLPDGTRAFDAVAEMVPVKGSMSMDMFYSGISEVVDRLDAMGKRVVLVHSAPVFMKDPLRSSQRNRWLGWKPETSISRAYLEAWFAPSAEALRSIESADHIDPMPFFCGELECQALSDDGVILFWDTGHLSAAGSEYFASRLMPWIKREMP